MLCRDLSSGCPQALGPVALLFPAPQLLQALWVTKTVAAVQLLKLRHTFWSSQGVFQIKDVWPRRGAPKMVQQDKIASKDRFMDKDKVTIC